MLVEMRPSLISLHGSVAPSLASILSGVLASASCACIHKGAVAKMAEQHSFGAIQKLACKQAYGSGPIICHWGCIVKAHEVNATLLVEEDIMSHMLKETQLSRQRTLQCGNC